jgi:hypothetical protein
MGRVYKIRHQGWHVDLAVKTPLPDAVQGLGDGHLGPSSAACRRALGRGRGAPVPVGGGPLEDEGKVLR